MPDSLLKAYGRGEVPLELVEEELERERTRVMSDDGPEIMDRLDRYAKLAMPNYPNDICSIARREIGKLLDRVATLQYESGMYQSLYENAKAVNQEERGE